MSTEEYQAENIEDIQDQIDGSQEYQDGMLDNLDASFPQSKEQSNQWSWFWKVVKFKDSTKVGNLDKAELGTFLMPVREAKRFAGLCGMFEQPVLNSFFIKEAENTLATSMSKKGWFVETSISTKKFTSRQRGSSTQEGTKPGWKIFQKKNAIAQGQ